jgi:hypothetical protein
VSSHADTRSSPVRNDGIDLPTLLITAVASAGAAYACSKIWAPGTLASAAFTPVLVAIIKEALSRPAQAVTKAVPVRGVVRGTPPPGGQPSARPSERPEPEPPPALDRVPQPGEVTYYHQTPGVRPVGGGGGSGRRWRVAIVTGLLGFVVAVLVLTVPELVAGQAASGGGRITTLFGGREQKRDDATPTTTAPTKTVTVKTRTVIVPAPATTTIPTATTTTPTTTATTPTTTTTTTPTVTQPPAVQP